MSAKPFFDTTILIYAVSKDDPRAEIAEGLLSAGGFLSVQVLNEFAAVARRKLKMPWDKVSDALNGFRSLCEPPVPVDVAIHDAALKIASRYGYQLYDALVLAAALETGCDTLCSEDMHHGQKIKGLTIRNPFRPA